jgi:chromosome segregation ATPase
MGNNNETTTKFKVDISDLKKGIQDANRQIRLANAEFKAVASSMDDWSKSSDGLKAKLTQLDTTMNSQKTILSNLEAEYEEIVKTQGEGSKGAEELKIKIANQKTAINNTQKQIDKYNNELKSLSDESKDADKSSEQVSKSIKDVAESADDAENGISKLGGSIGGALKTGIAGLATAAVGLVSAFLASGEASQEFTEDMGKLETAFKSAGHSAETAQKSYDSMVGILGETDQSVEAVNHLAKLTKNQEELAKWTDISAGVYATFGDSLPIEGLTEAANETAKVGQVTGPLADALNWAGESEEKFNAQLEKCNSEQERATLITDKLTQIYSKAGQEYQKVNADLIASRQATSDLTAAMSEIGNVAMPIMTALKQAGADLLTSIAPAVKEIGEAVKGLMSGADGAGEKLKGAL